MANKEIHLTQRQFFKFAIVGVVATSINYAAFYLLFQLGLSYVIAMGCGFLLGALLGYQLNRKWTYNSDEGDSATVAKYAIVYLVSMFAGMVVLWFIVEVLKIPAEWGNLPTIVITTLLNFVGTKFWVFKT